MKKKISLVLFLAIGLSFTIRRPGNSRQFKHGSGITGKLQRKCGSGQQLRLAGQQIRKRSGHPAHCEVYLRRLHPGGMGFNLFFRPGSFGNRSLYFIQFREVHPGSDRLLLSRSRVVHGGKPRFRSQWRAVPRKFFGVGQLHPE